jgi:hypothetical protein
MHVPSSVGRGAPHLPQCDVPDLHDTPRSASPRLSHPRLQLMQASQRLQGMRIATRDVDSGTTHTAGARLAIAIACNRSGRLASIRHKPDAAHEVAAHPPQQASLEPAKHLFLRRQRWQSVDSTLHSSTMAMCLP